MNEEMTQIKLTMPLIDDIELKRIDEHYNDIVSEYIKVLVKEKEQIICQRLMMNLQQENEKLKDKIMKLGVELEDRAYEQLKEENQLLKEDIKNIIKILSKNCDDLEATEEEFDSLYRRQNE